MKKRKKENRKKTVIILLIIGIILLIGCLIGGYFYYQKKRLVVDYQKKKTVNIHEKIYNTDLIKKVKNGEVITKKEKIDTSKTGKQKGKIKIKNYFHKIKSYSYTIEIVDKEAPVIVFNPTISTEERTECDLLAGVSVSDNSKEEIQVTVEGNYDFQTPGTYELEYVAKDSSGNEKREKFTLNVTEKVVIVKPVEGQKAPDREFTTSNGHKGTVKDGITYIDGIMIANKTYALPSSYDPGDIIGYVWEAFKEMQAGGSAEGAYFDLCSGYRSYNYQKGLYNRYVNQDGKAEADTYSARPGHSEHQTGLAMDIGKVDRNYGEEYGGIWLANNAWKYGFILRYPYGKTGETGYIYEPWHFRYVGKDLAKTLYNNGDWITLETYFGINSEYTY